MLQVPPDDAPPPEAEGIVVEAPLSVMVDQLEERVARDREDGVPVSVLLSAVGRRSYGPLLLTIGLIALSPVTIVPGITVMLALMALLMAVQMFVGVDRPWLPLRLLRVRVPRSVLFAGLDRGRPLVERIDTLVQPRLSFMESVLATRLVAVLCMLAALLMLTLSLAPMGAIAPSIVIALLGLGIAAHDGLWLAIGIALCAGVAWFFASLLV